MFTEVSTKSSADAVFDQVCDQIVGGALSPGASLPGERELAAQLRVSRSVVREALQRLAQAGLVEIRQGGATRVRDYQSATDLDLLQRLLIRADGSIDPRVLRSMLEMRISVGVDAARLCALRTDPALHTRLNDLVEQLATTSDLLAQQDIDLQFWEAIVTGSENIVYRLAYNGLVATYRPLREVIALVVEPELRNLADHRRIVTAVGRGDARAAERAARDVLESSSTQWAQLLDTLSWEDE
jgi:DNA-binding FadR family transcriptional regulator